MEDEVARAPGHDWLSVAILGIALVELGSAQSPTTPKGPIGHEAVEFNSASRPLGMHTRERALARGEDPKITTGARLLGYLARPPGTGPFPAAARPDVSTFLPASRVIQITRGLLPNLFVTHDWEKMLRLNIGWRDDD
jgi:hypothetical protein